MFSCIVGTQRSGTTVLRTVLDTHPKVTAFGEVFLPRHVTMKDCFFYFYERLPEGTNAKDLPRLFKLYLQYLGSLGGNEHVVFDCKYQFVRKGLMPKSLYPNRNPPLHEHLGAFNVKVIHLVRRNILATYVSGLLSSKTKVWATDCPEDMAERTVHVPVEGLGKTLTGRINEIEGFRRKLAYLDPLTITYENLFIGGRVPDSTLNSIADHMGVENKFNPYPLYQKIGLPLSEAIQNYDAVCKALKGTAHAHYLNPVLGDEK